MSTPVLPVSMVADPAGIVPAGPGETPMPIAGVSRDRESGYPRQRRKKKKKMSHQDEPAPSAEDPKGKKINIRA